ncbi:MAG: glycosyltransferase family 1 protein [Anaerolineae bacterium]|nr:glycosyltransferase family 4 protein [Thermoflexales bacterium]MDW8408696.1 glycosyltransferase family 1 protein [Anaerolineae bacterium]
MAHITIDYTPAVHQSAGIGRLTRESVRALLQCDSPHRFTLFCMGRPAASALSRSAVANGRAAWVVTPLNDRWLYRLWHRARLPVPVEVFSGRSDLYHATDFVLPPTTPRKRTVLTVHDLTFERAPDAAPPQLLRFLKRVVPQSVRRAHHLIADSQSTARDLIELYGAPAERITVIYSGIDARFCPTHSASPTSAAVRDKYALGEEPFVLTVGTLQPRKNHLTLVRAFAQVAERLPDLKLVIAGGKGWMYDAVTAEVARLNLNRRVQFIGFVEDADLPDVYRAARVFTFPSLYEGFGLPPLEAMACGIPVVASNTSSLPEVVGDAGLLVDPFDVDGLAGALLRAATDDVWRAQAIERGLNRARAFTWGRAAEQLLAVYDAVLAS